MPQVVIISNRLPVSVKKENGKLEFFPSVGGLATGLSSYANNKNNIWIGWPGIASDELTRQDRKVIVDELAGHNCSPVFLTRKQIDNFYNGYSNTVLWPLFHELRPQDRPGKRRDQWYKSFHDVNKLFAENAEIAAGSGAHIWVHDYQLLLVPEMLRKMEIDATIGFFLHIPFPSPKKFISLPRHRIMLKGVLGADLIGFHTSGYVENFLKTCEQCGLGTADGQTLALDGRTVRVSDFPMGIDYEKYASADRSKAVKQAVKKYRRKYRGKKIIVAVDRLDPSKGLLERVDAYGQFLEQRTKMNGKVVFVMVAAPSRTEVPAYQRLAKQLQADIRKLNRKYGNAKWQPIDYIYRTIPFEEVTALFHIADVAFIAPLRDGMNLAAKEFVASSRKNSVLILSETAGASQELRDALIVNPRKPETVSKALHDALTMRRSELRGRLARMKKYLKVNTVQKWAKDFVGALQKPLPVSISPGTPSLTRSLTAKHAQRLRDDFKAARKRLLLLDYDGSLVPFSDDFRKAVPPESLLRLIKKLGRDPANDVVIISGRSADDLDEWFGRLPVNLVAEHGASTKRAGDSRWRSHGKSDNAWKKQLLPVLEKYAARTQGAAVEEKPHSLVWHYRAVPTYYAWQSSASLKRALRPLLKKHGLHILKGNKVLEIKNPDITKGNTAKVWLDRGYDFVLGVGDDTTDEELFKVMPETGYSIKVRRGRTSARYRVLSHRHVVKLLQELAGQ